MTLRLTSPDGRQKTVRLKSSTCTVGSGEQCTLRLRSPGVAGAHCLIARQAARCMVRRLAEDSRINGRPFHAAELRVGDELAVGPWKIELLAAAAPDPAKPERGGRPQPPRPPDEPPQRALQAIEQLQAQLAEFQQQRHAWQQEHKQRELEGTRQQHELNQRLQEAAQQQRQLEQLRGEWSEEIRRARGGLESLQVQLDEELRELEGQRQDLARRREAWQTEWDRGRVRQLQWQKQLDERLEELQAVSSSTQQSDGSLQRLTSELERKTQSLDHELARMRGLRESLLAELQGWRNECEKSRAKLASHLDRADKRRATLESNSVEIAKLKQQWEEACGQLSGELRDQADQVESRLAELQSEASDAAKKRERWLQEQRAARLELDARAEQIDERLRLVDEKLNAGGDGPAALIERFDRLAASHEEVRKRVESAPAGQPGQADGAQLEKTIHKLREELAGARREWEEHVRKLQERQAELEAARPSSSADWGPGLEQLQAAIEKLNARTDTALQQQDELAEALQQQSQRAAAQAGESRRALEELRGAHAARDSAADEQAEARIAGLESAIEQLCALQQPEPADQQPWQDRLEALERKLAASDAGAAGPDAAWGARLEALEYALHELRLQHEAVPAQQTLPHQPAPPSEALETPLPDEVAGPTGAADPGADSPPSMTVPLGSDFQPVPPDAVDAGGTLTDATFTPRSPGELAEVEPDGAVHEDDAEAAAGSPPPTDELQGTADPATAEELPLDQTIQFEPVSTESPVSAAGLMGAAGPFDDQQPAAPDGHEAAEPSAAEPAPVDPLAATMAFGQVDPFSPKGPMEPAVPSPQPGQDSAGEDDIESYMASLLARVRTTGAPEPAQTPSRARTSPAAQPANPLHPDAFQPRSAAAEKNTDLTTLRDLANTTARTAIDAHSRFTINTKVRSKLLISIVALGFSMLFMWFSLSGGWWLYSASVVSLVVAIVAGFRYLHLSSLVAAASAIEAAEAAGQLPAAAAATGEGNVLAAFDALQTPGSPAPQSPAPQSPAPQSPAPQNLPLGNPHVENPTAAALENAPPVAATDQAAAPPALPTAQYGSAAALGGNQTAPPEAASPEAPSLESASLESPSPGSASPEAPLPEAAPPADAPEDPAAGKELS